MPGFGGVQASGGVQGHPAGVSPFGPVASFGGYQQPQEPDETQSVYVQSPNGGLYNSNNQNIFRQNVVTAACQLGKTLQGLINQYYKHAEVLNQKNPPIGPTAETLKAVRVSLNRLRDFVRSLPILTEREFIDWQGHVLLGAAKKNFELMLKKVEDPKTSSEMALASIREVADKYAEGRCVLGFLQDVAAEVRKLDCEDGLLTLMWNRRLNEIIDNQILYMAKNNAFLRVNTILGFSISSTQGINNFLNHYEVHLVVAVRNELKEFLGVNEKMVDFHADKIAEKAGWSANKPKAFDELKTFIQNARKEISMYLTDDVFEQVVGPVRTKIFDLLGQANCPKECEPVFSILEHFGDVDALIQENLSKANADYDLTLKAEDFVLFTGFDSFIVPKRPPSVFFAMIKQCKNMVELIGDDRLNDKSELSSWLRERQNDKDDLVLQQLPCFNNFPVQLRICAQKQALTAENVFLREWKIESIEGADFFNFYNTCHGEFEAYETYEISRPQRKLTHFLGEIKKWYYHSGCDEDQMRDLVISVFSSPKAQTTEAKKKIYEDVSKRFAEYLKTPDADPVFSKRLLFHCLPYAGLKKMFFKLINSAELKQIQLILNDETIPEGKEISVQEMGYCLLFEYLNSAKGFLYKSISLPPVYNEQDPKPKLDGVGVDSMLKGFATLCELLNDTQYANAIMKQSVIEQKRKHEFTGRYTSCAHPWGALAFFRMANSKSIVFNGQQYSAQQLIQLIDNNQLKCSWVSLAKLFNVLLYDVGASGAREYLDNFLKAMGIAKNSSELPRLMGLFFDHLLKIQAPIQFRENAFNGLLKIFNAESLFALEPCVKVESLMIPHVDAETNLNLMLSGFKFQKIHAKPIFEPFQFQNDLYGVYQTFFIMMASPGVEKHHIAFINALDKVLKEGMLGGAKNSALNYQVACMIAHACHRLAQFDSTGNGIDAFKSYALLWMNLKDQKGNLFELKVGASTWRLSSILYAFLMTCKLNVRTDLDDDNPEAWKRIDASIPTRYEQLYLLAMQNEQLSAMWHSERGLEIFSPALINHGDDSGYGFDFIGANVTPYAVTEDLIRDLANAYEPTGVVR